MKVIIALGSNYNAENNIRCAIELLNEYIYNIQSAQIIENEPVGFSFEVANFFNTMVIGNTDLTIDELEQRFKSVEKSLGRNQEDKKKGVIHIDIDLMEHNGIKLHMSDWSRGYIKILADELGLQLSQN